MQSLVTLLLFAFTMKFSYNSFLPHFFRLVMMYASQAVMSIERICHLVVALGKGLLKKKKKNTLFPLVLPLPYDLIEAQVSTEKFSEKAVIISEI